MSLLRNMRHFGDGQLPQDVPSRRTKRESHILHSIYVGHEGKQYHLHSHEKIMHQVWFRVPFSLKTISVCSILAVTCPFNKDFPVQHHEHGISWLIQSLFYPECSIWTESERKQFYQVTGVLSIKSNDPLDSKPL